MAPVRACSAGNVIGEFARAAEERCDQQTRQAAARNWQRVTDEPLAQIELRLLDWG